MAKEKTKDKINRGGRQSADEEDKERMVPVFNLNIELINWQGPYTHRQRLIDVADNLRAYQPYDGTNIVLCDGTLRRGTDDDLGTFFTKIDLSKMAGYDTIKIDGGAFLRQLRWSYEGGKRLVPFFNIEALVEKIPVLQQRNQKLLEILEKNLGLGITNPQDYTPDQLWLGLLEHYKRLFSNGLPEKFI